MRIGCHHVMLFSHYMRILARDFSVDKTDIFIAYPGPAPPVARVSLPLRVSLRHNNCYNITAITVNVASEGRTWCSATGCGSERLCRETELDVVAITVNVASGGRTWCSATGFGSERLRRET